MGRKELLNERAVNVKRGDELAAKADRTAEETTEWDALLDRRDEIDAELARIDRQAKSAALPGAGGGHVTYMHDNTEDAPFSGLGDFLQAVAKSDPVAKTGDPRLFAAASGASQGVPSDGGFLVGTQFSDELLTRARAESPLIGLCKSIPIGDGFDSVDLPVIDETSRATGSRYGGVQVYRKAEAETVTATKPKFGELKIEASEIMGLAYATERLLQNVPALESIFGDAFAEEFAFKVTDEIVRGPGGAQCLGVLSAPATVSQAKEDGQAAATINVANLSKMWSHVPSRSKSRGVWLINNDVEPQLDILSIPAGTAALEPRFVTYDAEGAMRIKGRPVIRLDQCATLGTVGDIIYMDPTEYILAPKGSITGQESMHVRFIYNEMTFRWTYYINGRPAWLSSLTPFKGSTSLSPYVTLATRA